MRRCVPIWLFCLLVTLTVPAVMGPARASSTGTCAPEDK